MKNLTLALTLLFASTMSFAASSPCSNKVRSEATARLVAQAKANGEEWKALEIDGFQDIGVLQAISEMDSQGLVEGKDFHTAVTKLLASDKIYMVYSSIGNGSATDLALVKRQDCSVTDLIRIQEE
jgi:hypothetical protein